MKLTIEFGWHTFGDGEWWFELGVSCQKAMIKRMVFTIALGIFSIYIRW
jgi:hypothetical protein